MRHQLSITLTERAAAAVSARSGARGYSSSGAISRAVERYVEACARSIPQLSDGEWSALALALEGHMPAKHVRAMLAIAKEQVSKALALKLGALKPAELTAVADELERRAATKKAL